MDSQASFAAKLYDQAARLQPLQSGPEVAPAETAPLGAASFAETLAKAAQEITDTLQRGENVAQAATRGQGDAQAVVEALTATELALQTAVTVRDRVVEAYQEVLRMPV
ncbi:MAG: flagellar hook-basal body complex protein FliE [Pseudomonadota bacterium]